MTTRIRILDADTANQIAAGEVVERPASVVKELVENAIDAGSGRILVELREGGSAGIVIQDDGCGMPPEDVRLAIERHATSKIRTAGDLEQVRTLGFRGEALPSIAAVARLEIVTRKPTALAGTRLIVRGGQVLEVAEIGCPAGTRMTVSELFFNTPARKKHLKSTAVELGHCSQVLTSLALAHPGIAFRARHNGRLLLETPGSGRLLDAITALYGRELAGQLLAVAGGEADAVESDAVDGKAGTAEVGAAGGGMRVAGFAARPAAARGSRSHQQFLINGRPVASNLLRNALENAYRGLLPLHRYPVAVLHLEIDPARLDVNIHPSKLQVRFENEGTVSRLVQAAVRQALSGADLTPRIPLAPTDAPSPAPTPAPTPASAAWATLSLGPALGGGDWGAAAMVRETAATYAAPAVPAAPSPAIRFEPATDPGAALASAERWPQLRVLGQAAHSYIVAEGAGGLYIIDQHAAHERLNFEHFLARVAGGQTPGQPLAVPLSLHLGPRESALWEEKREPLERLGFRAEAFGGGTLLLREVPALFAGQAQTAFLAALDALATSGLHGDGQGRGVDDAPEWEYAYAAMASCKASVKARDPLRLAEMEDLLSQLAGAANPFTCPHGRPTLLRLTYHDLEKHFKRI